MQSLEEVIDQITKYDKPKSGNSGKLPMAEPGENCNSWIIRILSEKPIAFNPLLAKVSRSATAGLFMSQLLYWWDKGWTEWWIYKTIKEVQEETGLTRSEQDAAIKKWISFGVLEKRIFGIPPKRHFRIDIDKLYNLLKTAKQNDENGK